MNVLVTIGVCVKDAEKIIEEALQSIAKQDFPQELMELIIVDDGSKDKTLSIVKNIISKIDIETKIFSHIWKGIAYSRQVIIENARGKYIVWIDADYIIPTDFIFKHVDFMEKNPSIGVACGREIIKGDTLVAILQSMTILSRTLQDSPPTLTDTGGAIYRLNTIKEVGGFDINLKGAGEDIDINNRIRKTRWKISTSTAEFIHRHRRTWKSLWDECFWWGYGAHYIYHKHNYGFCQRANLVELPPIAMIFGLKYSFRVYKAIYQKKAFLLPVQWVFKQIAWCLGFFKSHIDHHEYIPTDDNSSDGFLK
ncbi:MAG: glycosyltransferase [Candidatus Bathyarchaeota archaeon]|nr:glycosyltransferase [Candidatus Bathyarchaeota archaeon]